MRERWRPALCSYFYFGRFLFPVFFSVPVILIILSIHLEGNVIRARRVVEGGAWNSLNSHLKESDGLLLEELLESKKKEGRKKTNNLI